MRIKIDSSKCIGTIAGSAFLDKTIFDIWYYKDIELQSGKIYGLVSEYGQGCMYLSYLLGGNVKLEDLQISIDDKNVLQEELKRISWNLEPSKEKYRNNIVKNSIEKAIKMYDCKESFEEIAKEFILTEPRYDRKLCQLSGERWRASAALGFASGKRIFFAPYECSDFYYQMSHCGLFEVLRKLADEGAVIVLPVGSDRFIKNFVDECIYLDRVYTE